MDPSCKVETAASFPGFIMVEMRELIIQSENALKKTNKMDDSNDKATIKRYGLT